MAGASKLRKLIEKVVRSVRRRTESAGIRDPGRAGNAGGGARAVRSPTKSAGVREPGVAGNAHDGGPSKLRKLIERAVRRRTESAGTRDPGRAGNAGGGARAARSPTKSAGVREPGVAVNAAGEGARSSSGLVGTTKQRSKPLINDNPRKASKKTTSPSSPQGADVKKSFLELANDATSKAEETVRLGQRIQNVALQAVGLLSGLWLAVSVTKEKCKELIDQITNRQVEEETQSGAKVKSEVATAASTGGATIGSAKTGGGGAAH